MRLLAHCREAEVKRCKGDLKMTSPGRWACSMWAMEVRPSAVIRGSATHLGKDVDKLELMVEHCDCIDFALEREKERASEQRDAARRGWRASQLFN